MHDGIFMFMLEYEYDQPARKQRKKNSCFLKNTFNKMYKEDALKNKKTSI